MRSSGKNMNLQLALSRRLFSRFLKNLLPGEALPELNDTGISMSACRVLLSAA